MKRILTGLFIGIGMVVAFLLREVNLYFFDVFIGVITLVGAFEVAKLLKKAGKNNIMIANVIFPAILYLWLIIAVTLKLDLITILIVSMSILVGVTLIVYALLWMLKARTKVLMEIENYQGTKASFCLSSAMSTAFGFVVPAFLLLIAVLLNHIEVFSSSLTSLSLFEGLDIGLIVLVAWLGTTIFSDICAFYVGSLIGGKKLCPKISPNKTISGAIGGILGSIIFSVLAYLIMSTNYDFATAMQTLGVNYFVIVIFAIVASLFTQMGDLFISLLKRRASVKDSGSLLPGHGGVMDRCDGLCFNAVWVLIFFVILL